MKFGGLISKAISPEKMYACCQSCNIIYQDDSKTAGEVICPNCNDCCLERGWAKEKALEYVDPIHRELLM